MRRRSVITPELHAKIIEMYRAGEKTLYIALTLGVSHSTVTRRAHHVGLSRGRGRWARTQAKATTKMAPKPSPWIG